MVVRGNGWGWAFKVPTMELSTKKVLSRQVPFRRMHCRSVSNGAPWRPRPHFLRKIRRYRQAEDDYISTVGVGACVGIGGVCIASHAGITVRRDTQDRAKVPRPETIPRVLRKKLDGVDDPIDAKDVSGRSNGDFAPKNLEPVSMDRED